MSRKEQLKLVKKRITKTGQVASLILLSIAVLLFLASAGIFFAQKKLLQTKAMIAADAGGMYLNSQIGSYAHYLACKYIGCKCRKKKRRWAMLAIIPLMIAAIVAAATGHVEFAIALATTAISLGVSDELQVEKGVKALNKMFKQLASTNVKEYYKWSTIYYVSQMLVDSGAMAGLLEDIKNKSESENSGKNVDTLSQLAESIAEKLLDAYDDTLAPHIPFNPHGGYTWNFPDLLGAIDEWDSLVGGRIVDPSFYTESDPDLGYSYTLSSTDYVRCVLFQNPYPDGDSDDLSLKGLMLDLREDYAYGIDALLSIKEFEECNPKEEDCSDEETFSVELDKAKKALQEMKDNITIYDLDTYGPLHTTTYCHHHILYHPCIDYHGDPYETLQEISKRNSPEMLKGDYQELKNDLIDQINSAIYAIDSFLARVDSIFSQYRSELNYWFGPVNYDYEYTWTDSLGRHHRLNVRVKFKLPRIKVKKKLFKVKIKLKRCRQTMHVTACRNGFCYSCAVHYDAYKGHGPTTSYWWIDGS